jgi:hypothetical protein
LAIGEITLIDNVVDSRGAMQAFDWERFLRQWSQAIIETMDGEEKQLLSPEVLASGWLGYPGATEAEIARAEARLKVKLPPSYRAFLKVSNGWRQTANKTDNFNHRFWSTEDIEQFSVRHLQWIKAFTERNGTTDIVFEEEFQELDDRWEPVGVADTDYFVYGDEQDPSSIRPEYLRTAIEISDVGFDSIYLLNPQVVTPDGEWEAWFFADYLPGADRYRSFQAMMEAEYLNFLELQTSVIENDESAIAAAASPPIELTWADTSAPPAADASTTPPVKAAIHFEQTSPGSRTSIPWQSLNQVSIEFQGRHLGAQAEYRTIASSPDLSQAQTWPGLAEHQLQQWLRHRLGEVKSMPLREPPTPPPPALSPASAESPPRAQVTAASMSKTTPIEAAASSGEPPPPEPPLTVNLDVEQLAIRQTCRLGSQILVRPADFNRTRLSGIGTLSSQQPFSIEVALHLVVERRNHPALPNVFYKAQVFVQSRTNHEWMELGKSAPQALERDRSIYTASLFNKQLAAGMYRLQIITTLSGAAMALSSFELPLLNVV